MSSNIVFYSFLVVSISIISIIPISIDEENIISKVLFTILSPIPLIISTYNLYYNYIRISFNSTKTDDHKIKLIPLGISFFLFVFSWATIFMLFWLYDGNNSWTDFDNNRSAYEMWLRFLYTSLLMSVGVGFASHVPQTTFCGIVAGFMSFISVVIGLSITLASALEVILENISTKENSQISKKNSQKKIPWKI